MDVISNAFRLVDRSGFVPDELKTQVDIDAPLPIGFGQTNSQPYTVELMLRWLEAELGDKVLDVGSGSGWTTALLSKIIGPEGKVYAVEKIPELVDFGRRNNRKAGNKNTYFFEAGKALGLPKQAPYDRILVSATSDKLPEKLLDQLKVGGKMVIPVRSDILEIEKYKDGSFDQTPHSGFAFVPLLD